MGPDGYTSKEVVYCPDLRESSNRFGICSVKKPRTLSWINTERLRSEIFACISTRISEIISVKCQDMSYLIDYL